MIPHTPTYSQIVSVDVPEWVAVVVEDHCHLDPVGIPLSQFTRRGQHLAGVLFPIHPTAVALRDLNLMSESGRVMLRFA